MNEQLFIFLKDRWYIALLPNLNYKRTTNLARIKITTSVNYDMYDVKEIYRLLKYMYIQVSKPTVNYENKPVQIY